MKAWVLKNRDTGLYLDISGRHEHKLLTYANLFDSEDEAKIARENRRAVDLYKITAIEISETVQKLPMKKRRD